MVNSHLCVRWKGYALAVASLVLFALGTVLGAYWTSLSMYLRTHSVGEFIHEAGPFAGVIVAICVFIWQANRARYTMRIDLILKLAERFDSTLMRKTRADAARALRESEDTDADAVSELLDFLEQIGFLWFRHAIDLDAAYEFFEGWIVPYCQKTATCRARWRVAEDAPELYSNLEKLFQALVDRERRETGRAPHRTPNQIDDFLKSEANLSPVEAKS
ncbi:DUF4760 domain-containing protein [Burkholderia pseudomallei]|uniref:DUF4760 domain-containing protein n=1 Tax=Burkholderia pseudomallei TaxID=28450 RepID=UPI00053725C5|nr:hypothetical protein [Burkholderia pseudomallei]KGX17492.1 hypothetical protein X896_2793 [Burkholderia pseudomallei ABCPW 1]